MEGIKLSFVGALLLSFGLVSSQQVTSMRWCTVGMHEEEKCTAMRQAFERNNLSPAVVCISGTTKEDCYQQIRDGRADLITLDGGDVYTAGKEYGLVPIMNEVYTTERYYGIAVLLANNTNINSFEDLRNKRSCHTGIRRTAGWNIPVGFMLDRGYLTPTDCGDDAGAVANFFSASCAPGAFTPANDPDGTNPRSLCAACSNPNCPPDSSERYQSYLGALRCLVEGAGDVAFIKPETLQQNTNGQYSANWTRDANLQLSDFKLLCPDGGTAPVGNAASCNMAKGVAHAVMTSPTKSDAAIQAFQQVLSQAQALFGADDNTNGFTMFESANWNGRDLLFKDTTQSLRNLTLGSTYRTYMGKYANTIDGLRRCPAGSLRWCTTSSEETRKCRDMRDAFDEASLSPRLSCYEETSPALCMNRLQSNDADVVTVDGGDLYLGGRQNKVVPVAGEDYGYAEGPASYWAVAVAQKGSRFGINDLQQRKSCHTGIAKTSGWNVPVGHLIKTGNITVDNSCDVPKAVGNFFSAGSCAPGANSPEYDPRGTNPDSLCNLCIGEGTNYCVRNSEEPYYGYSGAFRCLAATDGDVAFVKHTTVFENTDGNGTATWNGNLRSQDFELLCPDGSRAEVADWRNCNLAKVPSHTVVTAANKTTAQRQQIWNLLNEGQNLFKADPSAQSTFSMFDSSAYTGSNLLFKDSTQSLVDVGDRNTYRKWLSAEYVEDLDALNCPMNTGGTTLVAQASIILTVLMLIVQALAGRLE